MAGNRQNRFLIFVMTVVLVLSFTGCGKNRVDKDEDSGKRSERKSKKASSLFDSNAGSRKNGYENLVINDFPLSEEQYFVETKMGAANIFISKEVVKYPFQVAYSDGYPELSTKNGQITLSWTNNEEEFLRIDMVEGSREAYINYSNEPIDMGASPKTVDGQLYLPVNIIIEALNMKETYIKDLGITLIHARESFPKDILTGSWSTSHTDLFNVFKDPATGFEGLSSFEEAYQFNEDGTYRLILISVGGYEDTLIFHQGKYRVYGNTVVFYDTLETLYKGEPFQLVHKNKKLDAPSYVFIEDYDPEKDRIQIITSWLYRVK